MKADWTGPPDPLAALQAGDLDPFDRFVHTETATFLGYFRRLGASADDAEDLTQELFLRLVRFAARYRPGQRFDAFCFRVARNAWIDFERRRAVRPKPAAGGTEDEHGPRPEDRVARPADVGPEITEEAAKLLRGLAQLSPGHREVFELAVVQERPYPEVAELLGIPVGTVKSRMFHAARKLRELLEASPTGTREGQQA